MKMSFRWYGQDDPVTLGNIRQIPHMKGIVTAIYDIPVGEAWPLERIERLKAEVAAVGMEISVIESVPVHEDIKLGKSTRDRYIENYKETIRNLGKAGIPTVCYNFMPVFDWTRSDLAYPMEDGSNALMFDEEQIDKMDPLSGELSLPGWDSSYTKEGLAQLFEEYKEVTEAKLFENLSYFLKEIIPVAEASDVKMAIHPDDPPWNIFGLPRIVKDKQTLEAIMNAYDSPANGFTMCSGSLGASQENDFIELLDYFLKKDRVNFVHLRNIKRLKNASFCETAHPTAYGSIDMFASMALLSKADYTGAVRPDHGRMIWGEEGRPGYGLYDRALGAVYLWGLWEACQRMEGGLLHEEV